MSYLLKSYTSLIWHINFDSDSYSIWTAKDLKALVIKNFARDANNLFLKGDIAWVINSKDIFYRVIKRFNYELN